jgi:phosphopantothenoylcysteine decarboxylase/phosphopantothenate--cysteine ligase
MSEETVKRIVLGITGGIAAYKSAELTRLLKKAGIDVQVVMTDAGTRFITPVTLQALSGNAVYIDAWDSRVANNMAHIELSRNADAILIAPASANFLAKLASGLCNDLLSTLCIARQPTCPLFVAPAMNIEMWENPATQRNIARLRADGVTVLGPASGDQACGETGMGRMLDAGSLVAQIEALYQPKALMGMRALVTAGPTFEPIDPVRGITNLSSGKMGCAVTHALIEAGADVVLIAGLTDIEFPVGARKISIQTASQMFDAVRDNLSDVDLFFAVAAVADYTPASPKQQKIKKSTGNASIELVATTDILAWVAAQPNPPFCVGFAAESENVVEYALKKRQNKGIPMIVANLATSAIGSDLNEVTILDADGEHHVAQASKAHIARTIVAHAVQLFSKSIRRA